MKSYGMIGGYAKSKNNPGSLCICCKDKIFNRAKNASYCKSCYYVQNYIRISINNYTSRVGLLRKFKDYKISIRIKVVKKNNLNISKV